MATRKEICHYCDHLLQPGLFQDYCPNGLQIEGKEEVGRIASAVSASMQVIKEAAAWGADFLVVHHGLFWRDELPVLVGTKAQKVGLLLKNEISLAAYHLPLDAHQRLGNNWRAAIEMQWEELEPFYSYKGQFLGVKGRIPPMSPEEFKKKLEAYYKHEATAVFGGKERIERVGLISGGAYRSISDAVKEGLDAFITGNFDEPVWHQAKEEKIHFFALGHAATERIGPRTLGEQIGEHFGIPHRFLDEDNPF